RAPPTSPLVPYTTLFRSFLAATEQLIEPVEAERKLRDSMPAWQENWTSDDYVEMSHYAPLVRFYVARPALEPIAGAGPYPAWVMNALGGIPETIAPTIRVTVKTVAGTFLDLFADPSRLAEAKAEFTRRNEEDPMPALLPSDFEPPIDLPWPDYR